MVSPAGISVQMWWCRLGGMPLVPDFESDLSNDNNIQHRPLRLSRTLKPSLLRNDRRLSALGSSSHAQSKQVQNALMTWCYALSRSTSGKINTSILQLRMVDINDQLRIGSQTTLLYLPCAIIYPQHVVAFRFL